MASIPQPGLTIQQVLQNVTPTIYSPMAPACIVGPCYQIIEMQNSDGSVNSSALLTLSPILLNIGGIPAYPVGSKTVYMEVNGTNREYTFGASSVDLPIAIVTSKLNEGFAGYLYWDYQGNTIRVRTVSTGDSASLMFRSGGADTAHTLLGFNTYDDVRYYGSGSYENNPLSFPYVSLPDTRGIIDYLTFDTTEIDVARIWGGAIVTLSQTSAVNRNRYNRVGLKYDGGNGAGTWAFNQLTQANQGGTRFFASVGHVVSGLITYPTAKEMWLSTPLTGNSWDLNAIPNNQNLWPVGSGSSTSNRLLQTGRHAYADIQLSPDGVTTTAEYHFEAHGFQKYITDQSATPGVGVGAFGNQIGIRFTEVDVSGTGHGLVSDGVIIAPNQMTSAGVHGGGGFIAGDIGMWVYLEKGVTFNSWYLISNVIAGTATLQTTGGAPVVLAPDTLINFTISTGAYVLPHVNNPAAGASFPVEIGIDYCPAVPGVGAWGVVPSFCKAGAFDTAMKANSLVEPFLGPNTLAGSTNVSYLSGSLSAALADFLNGKVYGLNFGADPYNYAATSATATFPTVIGEGPLCDQFYAGTVLLNKTLTIRVNGGAEVSHTFIAAECDSEGNLITALNAMVEGTPFSVVASDTMAYATELYGNTGASLVTNALTDPSPDIAALTYIEATRVFLDTIVAQLYGSTLPRSALGGIYIPVSGINPATGVITLASSAGAGPFTSTSYRLLTTDQKVIKYTGDATIHTTAGYDASIEFGGDAANLLFVGPYSSSTADFTGNIYRGDPLRTNSGDTLYNGGSYVGTISGFTNYTWTDSVAGPHTLTSAYLDLTEKNATVGTALGVWYISANGITGAATDGVYQAGDLATTKPLPEYYFDTTKEMVYLKGGLNRDGAGVEYQGSLAGLAAGYKALRKDITVSGPSPSVQIYSTYNEMNTAIGPVNSQNPLALGVYLAMLNAPNIQVKAFGIDEVSTRMVYGTSAAYATAFDFLQSADIYAIAPLSNSPAVHELLDAHITAMADPTTGKSNRVCFVAEDTPSEKVPTTCGSAPDTAAPFSVIEHTSFEIAIDLATGFNIASVLGGKTDATGATVPIIGACTIANGLFITRTGDPFRYSVSEIKVGNILKCRVTGFSLGSGPGTSGNDDNYYATENPGVEADSPAWDADGETVSLYIRQAAINTMTSTGRAQLAAALASRASTYAYRRTRYVQPDSSTYLESGASTSIHSMYACAGLAGLCASTPPQQSFTNLAIAGIESVTGSWDLLANSDMDTAAGGGVWWLTQQDRYSSVVTRHQLTTDVSTLQTREASITHVLDYITKRLQVAMRGLAGKFNLTRNFLDYVSILVTTVINGMIGTVVANIGVTSIYIDPLQPDIMYVDITVTPYYPANQIKVTLVV